MRNHGGRDGLSGRVCAVECGDDGLLDLCAGEALATTREGAELLGIQHETALMRVDGEYIRARRAAGEIDEEDLVEPAFAHQLRRDGCDVVCRRDDEDA